MNDFEYDCYERKQLARQAKYKKNGSKSKKCTLPQDNMTDAQLRKQNGEVYTFSMNRPMRSWATFVNLSPATATEYVMGLHDEYGASVGDLADMFGVSYNTVWNRLNGIGVSFGRGGRKPDAKIAAWRRFLSSDDLAYTDCDDLPLADEEDKQTAPVEEQVTDPEPETMRFCRFTVSFGGAIRLDAVMNSLRHVLGDNAKGTLNIEFTTEN